MTTPPMHTWVSPKVSFYSSRTRSGAIFISHNVKAIYCCLRLNLLARFPKVNFKGLKSKCVMLDIEIKSEAVSGATYPNTD